MATQERFMMGRSLDGLSIRSYLERKNLVEKIEGSKVDYETNKEVYILRNGYGEVFLVYNKSFGLMEIVLSEEVPEKYARELKAIAEISRRERNLKEQGVAA